MSSPVGWATKSDQASLTKVLNGYVSSSGKSWKVGCAAEEQTGFTFASVVSLLRRRSRSWPVGVLKMVSRPRRRFVSKDSGRAGAQTWD